MIHDTVKPQNRCTTDDELEDDNRDREKRPISDGSDVSRPNFSFTIIVFFFWTFFTVFACCKREKFITTFTIRSYLIVGQGLFFVFPICEFS